MIARALLMLVALAASSGAAARTDPARYMGATLLAETAAPKVGSTILVGFRFTPKPGWHGYWSNPGDSGIAPTVRWTAPKGVSFGPLLHPAPTLISDDGIDSFVHDGPHVLLSRMTVGRPVTPGTPISVKADLSWAACTATQCVPLRATFTLDLVAGDGENGASAAVLRAAASKLPRPAEGATFALADNELRFHLPDSVRLQASDTRFFPDESGHFDAAAQKPGSGVIRAPLKGAVPSTLSGVVSDGRHSYRLTFRPGPPSNSVEESEAADPAPQSEVMMPQPVSAGDVVAAPTSTEPPEPADEPQKPHWSWLLLAFAMPIAAGWLWRRKR